MNNRRKKRQNSPVPGGAQSSLRSSSLQTQQPSISHTFHWRDHPIVIAALAVVGTFTVTSYVFKEIIVPTQIAGLPALKENVEKLQSENSKQASEIESLKKVVEGFQYQTLFKANDPFPVTLGAVRLGQPISDLETQYSEAKVEKSDGYWNVTFGYGVVTQGTYYYNEKTKKISHVMFWLSTELKLSDSFLQDRLEESFGKPASHPKKDFFQWKASDYNVYKSDSVRFLIHGSNHRPGYWPES